MGVGVFAFLAAFILSIGATFYLAVIVISYLSSVQKEAIAGILAAIGLVTLIGYIFLEGENFT